MIRMMQKLGLGLVIVLFVAGCSKESEPSGIPGYNPPATASQTVLLYMPGENLLRFYRQNIEGIRRAVSASVPGNGRMLVCWQPENEGKATLQEIYTQISNNIWKTSRNR